MPVASEIGMAKITVIGAGVTGLWQALRLSRDGHAVHLVERSPAPFEEAASRLAGAMLAPFCEGEGAEPWITELGRDSVRLWRETFPETVQNGSLVLAMPRDMPELSRFSAMTGGHRRIGGDEIAALEPALAGRYAQGLFYPEEGHLEPARAFAALLAGSAEAGVGTRFGTDIDPAAVSAREADWIIDCRGMAARADLPGLRPVRGEMLVIETSELTLARPVRLLHPRFPLYIVPWRDNRFMIGATVIESGDAGPVTLRSALDLLGTAYALHPAFGEARLVRFAADLRPSFPDNAPRIIVHGRHIYVNGLYRHGFLLAPVLAGLVARYITDGTVHQDVFIENYSEWRAAGDRRTHAR
jgi:glycine oxidase